MRTLGLADQVCVTATAAQRARAFSMIELAIVIAIIGVIGAIAIPRMSRAVSGARENAMITDVVRTQKAIDHYMIEHEGRTPAHNPNWLKTSSSPLFWQRLTAKTDADGTVNASGLYGPYLRNVPFNVESQSDVVRIDGADAGTGGAGWHFDTVTSIFLPDDSEESADRAIDILDQGLNFDAGGGQMQQMQQGP